MPLVSKNFSDIITFTRASTGTFFNSSGVLTTAAIDAPRFDYNPSTLAAQGFLVEEARTNSIRNNTMQGAVAGTPGTAPTNWSVTGTANGLTRTISTGIENGITYVDLRYAGTATAASFCIIRPEAINQVAAASGQSWTSSLYIRVAAGSTANITAFENWIIGADAGGAIIESTQLTPVITGTMTRFAVSRTMNNASTAFVYPYLAFTFNNGAAIDITLRIGLPQLELGAFATSVIPTTTTALTRSADVASVNTLSPWYNAAEGTLYSEATFTNTVSFNTTAALGDGTASNAIRTIQWNNGTDRIFQITNAGAGEASFAGTGQVGTAKFAGAYKLNDVNASKNGSIGTTDTTATIPTVNALWLGATGNANFVLNGWLRRVTYYPRRLSNAELQAITA